MSRLSVDETVGDVIDGADGVFSLREAVIFANENPGEDKISLPAGTYTLSIPGRGEDTAYTGDLDVTDPSGGLIIAGAGPGRTIIDGAGLDRVFHVLGTELVLQGLTVTGGAIDGGVEAVGGAIAKPSGYLTLVNCDVVDNTAAAGGGGIYSGAGGLDLRGTLVSGNEVTAATAEGGGIYSSGLLSVETSTIAGNAAPSGGGVANRNGLAEISRSTVSTNSATELAGGGVLTDGLLTLDQCTVTSNAAASFGGGIAYGDPLDRLPPDPVAECVLSPSVIHGGETLHDDFSATTENWVTFNACIGRSYSVETLNLEASADTIVELYTRDCTRVLTWDDDGGSGVGSSLAWTASESGSYHLLVRQKDGTTGADRGYDLTLTGNSGSCELWARRLVGSAPAGGWVPDLIQASDGGYFTIGTADVTGVTQKRDLVISKLDPQGSVVWSRLVGGRLDETARDTAETHDGGVLAMGTTLHDYSTIVLKFDPKGNLEWERVWHTGPPLRVQYSYGISLKSTSDRGYVLVGYATPDSVNATDIWIMKVDADNVVEWSKTFGGGSGAGGGLDGDYALDVEETPDGGYIVAGEAGYWNRNARSAWLLKLDGEGNLEWQKWYLLGGRTNGRNVQPTADGGYIASGYTNLDGTYWLDIWVMKLDAAGNPQWQKAYGTVGDETTHFSDGGIVQTSDGGYVLAARTRPVHGSGHLDALVFKIDADGEIEWQRVYGGPEDDYALDVLETADGSILVGGARTIHSLKLNADGEIDGSCAALTDGNLGIHTGNERYGDTSVVGVDAPIIVKPYNLSVDILGAYDTEDLCPASFIDPDLPGVDPQNLPGGQYLGISNTLVAANTAPNGPDGYNAVTGPLTSGGHNLVGIDTDFALISVPGDLIGTAASPVDPALGSLEDNGGRTPTHLPQAGSPVVDTGFCPVTALSADQRGIHRPIDITTVANGAGNGCDIGSCELGVGQTLPSIGIPVRWCVVEGAASFGATPDQVLVNEILRLRHDRSSDEIFEPQGSIRLRSGANDLIRNYPILTDPDTTIGVLGDVHIDPDTNQYGEFLQLIADCRTAWETADPTITGITAVQINQFVDDSGNPLSLFGLGGRAEPASPANASNSWQIAQQMVAGRVMIVDAVHLQSHNPPDEKEKFLGHEFGHGMSLRHGDGIDNDSDGILDNDDDAFDELPKFDGTNLMQYRLGIDLTEDQVRQARDHVLITIPDIVIDPDGSTTADNVPLDPAIVDVLEHEFADVPEWEFADVPEWEFADVPEWEFADVPEWEFADVPEWEFADVPEWGINIDGEAGNEKATLFASTGGLLWPPHIQPTTTYFFYLYLDEPAGGTSYGADPELFGFPPANRPGVDVIVAVVLESSCSADSCTQSVTQSVYDYDDDQGSGFVLVYGPATAHIDPVAVGLYQETGGAAPEVEEQMIAFTVRPRFPASLLTGALPAGYEWQLRAPVILEVVTTIPCETTLPNGTVVDCQCETCDVEDGCDQFPGCAGGGTDPQSYSNCESSGAECVSNDDCAPGEECIGGDIVVDDVEDTLTFEPPVLPQCIVTPAVAAPGVSVTMTAWDFPIDTDAALSITIGSNQYEVASPQWSGGEEVVPIAVPLDAPIGNLDVKVVLVGFATAAECIVNVCSDVNGNFICDADDPDDDGDGVGDAGDTHTADHRLCGDTDHDLCDDCHSGSYDPTNDGPDRDSDGLCDTGDPDPVIHAVNQEGTAEEGGAAMVAVDAAPPRTAMIPLSYAFDCDYDGIYEVGPQGAASGQCVLPDEGTYTVGVQVSATDVGGTATASTALTVANVAPLVDAGADGTVVEGTPFSGDGSFADPGTDSWTATVDYGVGAGAQPLSLGADYGFDLQYDYADNGIYTVTVTVSDGDGGVGTDTLEVIVSNAAPIVDAGSDADLNEGDPLDQAGSFADPGADTWEATVDYGDGSGAQLLDLDPQNKSFDLDYPYTDNGTYTVTVTVTDDDGDSGSDTLEVIVSNVAPTVNAGDPVGSAIEGEPFLRNGGSFADPGADTWEATVDYGDGFGAQPLALGQDNTFNLDYTYVDNGTYTITVTVTDDDAGSGSDTIVVTVTNAAPVVGPITAPVDPVEVGTEIPASASFVDSGSADTHSAVWDWGDGSTSAGSVDEFGGAGTVSGLHIYDQPGVYRVILTVTDNDEDLGFELFQYVVVYDPDGGFVTGSGRIQSPPGAFAADPALVGEVKFGLNCKYKQSTNTLNGKTDFDFKLANLNFRSDSYVWLVVDEERAQYMGTGTVNGQGAYGFFVVAIDNDVLGLDDEDRFRIKIWDLADDTVIYDNQMDEDDDADAATELSKGSIKIHN
jgi:PKD repeat protein